MSLNMHSSEKFYTVFPSRLLTVKWLQFQSCVFFFFFLSHVHLFVLTERKQKKDDDEMMEGSCLSSPPPLPLSHFSPPSGAVC